MSTYNYIQSFFVNSESVDNSTEVMITSIVLYIKTKPVVVGMSPGMTISLCEVSNNSPVPENVLAGSVVRLDYDRINASSNSLDGTYFVFSNPVPVKTNQSYGVMITFDDPSYELWENVQGNKLVSPQGVITDVGSPGTSTNFNGNLYKSTMASNFNNTQTGSLSAYTPFLDRDLKFKVNVARFDMTNKTKTISLTPKDYEFLTIKERSGVFTGGEIVYQNDANKAGTITASTSSKIIVGVGASFTAEILNKFIVFSDGVTTDAIRIVSIINDTNIEVERFPRVSVTSSTFKIPPIAKVYVQNTVTNNMVLVDSNATDATFRFTENSQIIGVFSGARCRISTIDKQSVDSFIPRFRVGNPAFSTLDISYKFANETGTMHPSFTSLSLNTPNEIKDYDGYVYSRSYEVGQPVNVFGLGDSKKSGISQITLTYNSDKDYSFTAPFIDGDQLDIFTQQNYISNTTNITKTRNAITYSYDTEVDRYGIGLSKYITKKINFAPNRAAEDIVVYASIYKPQGTEIKIYAKLHNALDKEAFDDKKWTPLVQKNEQTFSSPIDENDVREYEFGLPQAPDHIEEYLTGFSAITTGASNVVATSGGDITAKLVIGDVVKIFSNNKEQENYELFVLTGVSANQILLDRNVTNANITGTMSIKLMKYPNSAYNNFINDNVCRYISTEGVAFNGFNSMQIKVVMISDNTYVVPKLDSIQVLGVSA